MRSFAARTGQLWKFYAWVVMTVAGLIATVVLSSLFSGNPIGLPVLPVVVYFFATCVGSFIWWAGAIKCPRCKRSLAWHQMTQGGADSFHERLAITDICPMCGFDPAQPEQQQDSTRRAPSC
jgi:hypothetical protein